MTDPTWQWHGSQDSAAGRATYRFAGGNEVTISMASFSEARELAEAIERDRAAVRQLARIGMFGEIRQMLGTR